MDIQLRNIIESLNERIANNILLSIIDGEKRVYPERPHAIMCTTKGGTRKTNQDRIIYAEINKRYEKINNIKIVILADGMGGLDEGEKTASLAVSSFITYLSLNTDKGLTINNCEDAVHYSNKIIFEKYKGKSGATISAIIIENRKHFAVNVGDSRIYAFKKGAELRQITKDDTFAAHALAIDDDSNNWQNPSILDNRLIQHIGMGSGLLPHIIDLSNDLKNKNAPTGYLITSDGAHYIGKTMISQIINTSRDINTIPKRLVSVSTYLSDHDNSSSICIPLENHQQIIKNDNEQDFIDITFHTVGDKFHYTIFPPNKITNEIKSSGVQLNIFNKNLDDNNKDKGKRAYSKKNYKTNNISDDKKHTKPEPKPEKEHIENKDDLKVDIINITNQNIEK